MAGHLALVILVIYGSFLHSFMVYKCSTSLLHLIEKSIRNFIWTGSISTKKLVMVSWDDCCRPKKEGGLGLKRLYGINSAMLCKLA